jgi:hypothetical protein
MIPDFSVSRFLDEGDACTAIMLGLETVIEEGSLDKSSKRLPKKGAEDPEAPAAKGKLPPWLAAKGKK